MMDVRPSPAPTPSGAGAGDGELLSIRGLRVDSRSATVLDGIDLSVRRGRTLGVVGESGSGKSMTALAVLGLLPPGVRATHGSIRFRGEELIDASEDRRRDLRGSEIAMVFQDPLAALNPVLRIGDQVTEIRRRRDGLSAKRATREAIDLLRRVGLPAPETKARAYPHQLSGGQRQRAVIAMALAGGPSLLLADEPTTALDVTVQARILRLLRDLQHEEDIGMLLISHDLRVMAHFSDDLVVMQHGKVVEAGATAEVLAAPRHDYTRSLIADIPPVFPPRSPDSEVSS